jgi:hypothetical protein
LALDSLDGAFSLRAEGARQEVAGFARTNRKSTSPENARSCGWTNVGEWASLRPNDLATGAFMRLLPLILACGVLLAACALRGTPQMSQCLGNPEIVKAFTGPDKAAFANTVMVGGLGPEDKVSCYWSDAAGNNPVQSEAYLLCGKEEQSQCTVLAQHGQMLVKGKLQPNVAPPYLLTGSFAEAFTTKYRGSAPTPTEGALQCSSEIGTSAPGQQVYLCR